MNDINKILNIPDFVQINEVKKNSLNMSNILNDDIIENLRSIYAENRTKFTIITNELSLRGIGFRKTYANNYLREIPQEFDKYILSKRNSNKFKKINFSYYGLEFLIKDYKIMSDLFFNYIPIEAFLNFIPNKSKYPYLINDFKDAGFEIVSNKSFKKDLMENAKKKLNSSVKDNCDKQKKLNNKNDELVEHLNINKITHYTHLLSKSNKELLEFYFVENDFYDVNSQSIEKTVDKFNILNNENMQIKKTIQKNMLINLEIYTDIKNIKICDLFKAFEDKNYLYLSDTRTVEELTNSLYDYRLIKNLNTMLETISSFKYIVNFIKNTIKDKQLDIIYRRLEGETLQSIAESYSVTRERIRQIEKRVNKRIKSIIEKNNYTFKIFNIYLRQRKVMTFFDIIKTYSISNENKKLLIIILNLLKNVKIIEKLVIHPITLDNINNEIKKIEDRKLIHTNDLKYQGEKFLLLYIYLFDEYKYHSNGSKFVKSSLSIADKIEYIFKNEFTNLQNNEIGYLKLKKKMESIFGEKISSSRRALFTRVASVENIILTNKNTYSYDEFNYVDEFLLEEIKSSIDEQLSKYKVTNAKIIFSANNNTLKKYNVTNHYHLYSIIQKFFSEALVIGKGNTLNIYKEKEDIVDIQEILMKYIINNISSKKISEISKEVNLTINKIEQFVVNSNDFIINENKNLLYIRNIKKEKLFEDLENLIKEEIKKGYIIVIDFFLKLYSKQAFEHLLIKYNINETYSFSQLLKKISNNIIGGKQILFSKEKSYRTVEDIMPEIFSEKISRQKLIDFQLKIGYSEQRIYQNFNNVYGLKSFLPYDKNILINNKYNLIDSVLINQLEKILNDFFEKEEVLTKSYIDTIIINLLDENEYISYYVIAYLADILGYNLVEAYFGSKYELPIILDKQDDRNYEELINDIVIKRNKAQNKNGLIKILKYHELMNENAANIYYKLKDNDYFYIDIVDNIIIKEN